MQTRHKLLIDRLVGIPLVVALNGLTRLAGATLRRNHSAAPEAVRSIVVAKFVGMGSILQATAMMEGLRERFPNARIHFLTSKSNRPLMDRLPPVDDAIYIDESGLPALALSSLRAVAHLMRLRVDLYFDLEVYSAYAALISVLSLARNRYGFYRTSAGFKNGLHTHLMYFNTRRPVRQIYHQLGRMAGIGPWEGRRVSRLQVMDADKTALASKLPDLPTDFIVVNPNASDLLLERRWPLDRFADLIEKLSAQGHRVALVGAPSEKAWVEELCERLRPETRAAVINTAGVLKLNELFALLEQARCVVTNDTGPMHMSVALRRPTVCLFGPVDPAHYGFHEEEFVETIHHAVYCSPCVHEVDEPPCNGNNICMQRIQVIEVLEAIARLLANKPRRPAPPEVDYSDDAGKPLGMVLGKNVVKSIN